MKTSSLLLLITVTSLLCFIRGCETPTSFPLNSIISATKPDIVIDFTGVELFNTLTINIVSSGTAGVVVNLPNEVNATLDSVSKIIRVVGNITVVPQPPSTSSPTGQASGYTPSILLLGSATMFAFRRSTNLCILVMVAALALAFAAPSQNVCGSVTVTLPPSVVNQFSSATLKFNPGASVTINKDDFNTFTAAESACETGGCNQVFIRNPDFGCQNGLEKCPSGCVDTSVDASNCGSCGTKCPANANTFATCNGACSTNPCPSGTSNCDSVGPCEDLDTTTHCGTCGNSCTSTQNAASVSCSKLSNPFKCRIDECKTGFGDCDADFANGCEKDTTTDNLNCAACRYICPANVPLCVRSLCSANLNGATCGDGIKGVNEQCDDGNGIGNDGCSETCRLEQGFNCNVTQNPSVCRSICGDGLHVGREQCDDNNIINGDGCTQNCTVERGFTCSVSNPSVCRAVCGDGIKAGAEECDDGNVVSGDGCSSTCKVQSGWQCNDDGECTPKCGDAVKSGGETCDDGNSLSGDGCSSTCVIESGWQCDGVGAGSCYTKCGDGLKRGNEQCDDGNFVNGDGCEQCAIQTGWTCNNATPSVCTTICGDGIRLGNEGCDDHNSITTDGCNNCIVSAGFVCSGSLGTTSVCVTRCGDSIIAGSEQCDDGNQLPGDGCSGSCRTEAGYTCVGAPSVCSSTCGDRVIVSPPEQCDDGNTNGGDGCGTTCLVEFGFSCTGTPSACKATCGDSFKASSEECDDGNLNNSDGCSSQCKIESGYRCNGTLPSVCTTICGNGVYNGNENCDDRNLLNGDGCSSVCVTETGWNCTAGNQGSASTCTRTCGDGLIVAGELCDDANLINGDGCDSRCTIEAGYTCSGVPSTCSRVCGDGKKAAQEECDDGNAVNNDGCSSNCTIEVPHWNCPSNVNGNQSSCAPVCGSNLRTGIEVTNNTRCDDGNTKNADGCDSTCTIEVGWNCTGNPSVCTSVCQDGIVVGQEKCDDGNNVNNDGCTTNCTLERGWNCTGQPSVCNHDCGDGIRALGSIANETCDDNRDPADGCTSCAIDHGYTCEEDANGKSSCETTCGDGFKALVEGCDDGNENPGDGCSALCLIESGFSCTTGDNSVCTPICGDAKLRAPEVNPEQCDDGGNANSDGCSSTCKQESGYRCTNPDGNDQKSVCSPVCGDSIVIPGPEVCDDGNTLDGDGCSKDCKTKNPGWTCTPGSCITTCGDGFRVGNESCDDGNLINGDGCSNNCTVEVYWRCTLNATTLLDTCDGICGDGKVRGKEQCDDSAATPGPTKDGCSATCRLNVGWNCTNVGDTVSTCFTTCGDGHKAGEEVCDDGNRIGGDGCAPDCQNINDGYYCVENNVTQLSFCDAICGNSQINGQETCDDGNKVSNDGCSGNNDAYGLRPCVSEPGWRCTGSSCVVIRCGDGIRAGLAEKCDDANDNPNDGCNNCSISTGYRCDHWTLTTRERPSNCSVFCGDGLQVAPETCDDGNSVSGDGCSSTCQIEQGWTCNIVDPGTGTDDEYWACSAICGDGLAVGPELKQCNWFEQLMQLGCVSGCDDGPPLSGDGCDRNCHVEPGYYCTTNANGKSVCTTTCGDGVIAGNEDCDDCNVENSDGCSSTCLEESGWDCSIINDELPEKRSLFQVPVWLLECSPATYCSSSCGDGLLRGDEECDDGNLVGGGCSDDCSEVYGYYCDTSNPDVRTPCPSMCGDGIKVDTEDCDAGENNGPAASSGCNATCKVNPGWRCTTPGDTSTCNEVCGDGIKTTSEACDDGNTVQGDGCHSCTIETPGWYCTSVFGQRSNCTTRCGDNSTQGTEQCDTAVATPGCSANCTINQGYVCTFSGARYANCKPLCGDGYTVGTETCDDRNTVDTGDGCTNLCTKESGWNCNTQSIPSACTPICGDGRRIGEEQCDDANQVPTDGCSYPGCNVRRGWKCSYDSNLRRDVCHVVCGDGILGEGEQCDNDVSAIPDTPPKSGDGCSSVCTVEAGYTCDDSETSVCTCKFPQICGPG